MTIKELSKQLKLPLMTLNYLVQKGLIHDPPTDEDVNNLSFLSQIWGDKELLKHQLTKYNQKSRLAMIKTAEMDKITAYIFNRYLNAEGKLMVQQVAEEVNHYYHVPIDDKLKKLIYKTREKARKAKQRMKRK